MRLYRLLFLILALPLARNGIAQTQDSLSFATFALESGTDLQVGATYRFSDVAPGLDALVAIESISGGAALVQIDDPSPSSARLQPSLLGSPDQEPRVDLSLTLVARGGSDPVTVPGLEISVIDVDGSSGRQEFVILSGIHTYSIEGPMAAPPRAPSELTIETDAYGTKILGSTNLYNEIDAQTTQTVAVARTGSLSRLYFSIGQTGVVSTAGIARLYSFDFRPGQIIFDDPVTSALSAQIGAALAVGGGKYNGDGSYDVALTYRIEGFADVPLCDLQIVSDLSTSFGIYVPSGPLSAGQYTLSDPTISSLDGGAVVSLPNALFDGSADQNLIVPRTGDRLPVGGSAEVRVVVTWFPLDGVTYTTVQSIGMGDISEDGTPDGASTDYSHAGNDPDPEKDGPSNNSSATSIDLSRVPVELGVTDELAQHFKLGKAYPNPFNPSTSISFTLQNAGPVEVTVFDAKGRLVKTLLSGNVSSGTHEVRFDADELPSGLYLYRLSTRAGSASESVVLLK